MRKKEQTDLEFQKIKDSIEKQKAVYEPIREQCDKEQKKLFKLEDKLEKYRLEHGMFYPLLKLAEFKDEVSDILSIKFVQRTKSGKFKVEEMVNDDLFFINDDGTFKYSSYEGGIIEKAEDGKWYHQYYGSSRKLDDYVGFLSIEFCKSSEKYDIAPPDMETYKE